LTVTVLVSTGVELVFTGSWEGTQADGRPGLVRAIFNTV